MIFWFGNLIIAEEALFLQPFSAPGDGHIELLFPNQT